MRKAWATGRWVGMAGLAMLAACDAAFMSRFSAALRSELTVPREGQACADRSDFAALVPDCPFEGVCFTTACEGHDQCYGSCEASRAECDRRFRQDMVDICNGQLEFGGPEHRECLYFASLYWAAVDAAGDEFYNCDFVPTEPRPGACCSFGAPPVCQDVSDRPFCAFQSVFVDALSCGDVAETFGGCPLPPNDSCEARTIVCEGIEPDTSLGRCEPSGEDGDAPAENRVCSTTSQDCAFGDPCVPYDGNAFRCIVNADNRLAATDGPDPGEACGFADENRFQADVWYAYTAPCTGTLTVQMCDGTFYDAVLAIYGNGDPEAECTCPAADQDPLVCDDDGCGGFATAAIASTPIAAGACYTIRLGGWSVDGTETGASRGVSRLDLGVLCD